MYNKRAGNFLTINKCFLYLLFRPAGTFGQNGECFTITQIYGCKTSCANEEYAKHPESTVNPIIRLQIRFILLLLFFPMKRITFNNQFQIIFWSDFRCKNFRGRFFHVVHHCPVFFVSSQIVPFVWIFLYIV